MQKFFNLLLITVLSLSYAAGQGTINQFGSGIFMLGVSPDGKYATGYDPNGGSLIWTKETGLTSLSGTDGSQACAVSNNGKVAGQFMDPLYTVLGLPYAGYFQDGQWNSLGIKPGVPEDAGASMAEGISADGTMISGSRWISYAAIEPVIWVDGVAQILEFEPIGQGARATVISADGTVVAGWSGHDYTWHPCVWINGVMRQIKHNNVWGSTMGVLGISPNGRYVALQYDNEAAVYDVEMDELTIIGSLTFYGSYASDVANDGTVIGYHQTGFAFDRTGFVYSPELGEMSINDYLVAKGIPEAATALLTCPTGISGNGLRITGFGGWMDSSWVVEIEGGAEEYLIEATANDETMGTVTGGGTYEAGTTATLIATPNPKHGFSGWFEDNNLVCEEETYAFTVEKDRSLVAVFYMIEEFLIEVTIEYEGWGTVTGGGVYEKGDVVTLVATPNSDYDFCGWYEDNLLVCDDETYTFVVEKNRSLVAKFCVIDNISETNLSKIKVFSQTGTVHILNEENINLKLIQVIDLSGKTLYSGTANHSTTININAAEGLYLVRIITENETEFVTKLLLTK